MSRPTVQQMTDHVNRLIAGAPKSLQHRLLPMKPVKSNLSYADALLAMGQVLSGPAEPSPAERTATAWQWTLKAMLPGTIDDRVRQKVRRHMAKLAEPLATPARPNGSRPPAEDHVFWQLARYGDLAPGSRAQPPAQIEAATTAPEPRRDSPDLERVGRLADWYLSADVFQPGPTGAPKWFVAPARQVLEAVLYSMGDQADDPKAVSQALERPLVPTVADDLRRGGELEQRLADQLETALNDAGKSRLTLVSALRVGADVQVIKARLDAHSANQSVGDSPSL